MGILAALKNRWNYSVENPGAGRLVYREGNREYTFPIYEEDGMLKLVAVPSGQRIHFFFNWHWHPQEFSAAARGRILPRIASHLRAGGARVKVIGAGSDGREPGFHPELFEQRARASELLAEAGFEWFSDYGSIDLLQVEYGLEIAGIRREADAQPMLEALKQGFPHWHHALIWCPEADGEPGWLVSISMFPLPARTPGWQGED